MKGEKTELWKKAPNALGKAVTDMDANAILKTAGGTSMPVGTGAESTGSARAPKPIGHDAKNITIKNVAGGDIPDERGGTSKSAKKGAYAKEMGTGGEKVSKMAQKVGSPRKGY